jgi:DNA-binding MarR family transcriptional regulator
MTDPQRDKPPFLRLVRALVEAYQAFVEVDTALLRPTGLTQAQFDVIATLGNTEGFAMRELSAKTLIAKGTLTGVIDRLEKKGLVTRATNPEDRRSFVVALTAEGEALFQRIFPEHLARLEALFEDMDDTRLDALREDLVELRKQMLSPEKTGTG